MEEVSSGKSGIESEADYVPIHSFQINLFVQYLRVLVQIY